MELCKYLFLSELSIISELLNVLADIQIWSDFMHSVGPLKVQKYIYTIILGQIMPKMFRYDETFGKDKMKKKLVLLCGAVIVLSRCGKMAAPTKNRTMEVVSSIRNGMGGQQNEWILVVLYDEMAEREECAQEIVRKYEENGFQPYYFVNTEVDKLTVTVYQTEKDQDDCNIYVEFVYFPIGHRIIMQNRRKRKSSIYGKR